VAIAGGAATLNRYLSLGPIDELRLHIVPITLGAGERVFDGVGGWAFDVGGGPFHRARGARDVAPDRQVIPNLGSCRPSGCA
jgi:hypothetical protein